MFVQEACCSSTSIFRLLACPAAPLVYDCETQDTVQHIIPSYGVCVRVHVICTGLKGPLRVPVRGLLNLGSVCLISIFIWSLFRHCCHVSASCRSGSIFVEINGWHLFKLELGGASMSEAMARQVVWAAQGVHVSEGLVNDWGLKRCTRSPGALEQHQPSERLDFEMSVLCRVIWDQLAN